MTSKQWSNCVNAIRRVENVPAWLKEQAGFTLDQILALPDLGVAKIGEDAIPSVEVKILALDYLDFLRQQIKLEPRGPEWTKILRARLQALAPFANKKVMTVMFFRKPHSATLRMRPDTGELIQLEND
jgi:hypothetical protein